MDNKMTLPHAPQEAALHADFVRTLQVSFPKAKDAAELFEYATNLVNVFRTMALSHRLIQHCGAVVQTGPFASMKMVTDPRFGASVPKLVGVYEYALHDLVKKIISTPYTSIINIGCAEGYYAVGFALHMPHTPVFALDIVPAMREACAAHAVLNGVENRISIRDGVDAAGLQHLLSNKGGARPLVLCDVEGAEEILLNPQTVPALNKCDMLVEQHDFAVANITQTLQARFAPTHDCTLIACYPDQITLPAYADSLPEIDRLLLTYEGRVSPTPWGWYQARS
jgi:hypothetical protein